MPARGGGNSKKEKAGSMDCSTRRSKAVARRGAARRGVCTGAVLCVALLFCFSLRSAYARGDSPLSGGSGVAPSTAREDSISSSSIRADARSELGRILARITAIKPSGDGDYDELDTRTMEQLLKQLSASLGWIIQQHGLDEGLALKELDELREYIKRHDAALRRRWPDTFRGGMLLFNALLTDDLSDDRNGRDGRSSPASAGESMWEHEVEAVDDDVPASANLRSGEGVDVGSDIEVDDAAYDDDLDAEFGRPLSEQQERDEEAPVEAAVSPEAEDAGRPDETDTRVPTADKAPAVDEDLRRKTQAAMDAFAAERRGNAETAEPEAEPVAPRKHQLMPDEAPTEGHRNTADNADTFVLVQLLLGPGTPPGNVRVYLNDVPLDFVQKRLLLHQGLEFMVPTSIILDDSVYPHSVLQMVLDEQTVVFPLNALLREKELELSRAAAQKKLNASAFSADAIDTLLGKGEEVEGTSTAALSRQDSLVMEAQAELAVRRRPHSFGWLSGGGGLLFGNVPHALKLLRNASSAGHAGAHTSLARMQLTGLGTHMPQDVHGGVVQLREALRLGHPEAQATMALLHASGWAADEVEEDNARATLYLQLAAEGGSAYGMLALAVRRLYGLGVSTHCEAAAHYLSAAASMLVPSLNDFGHHNLRMEAEQIYLHAEGRRVGGFRQFRLLQEQFNYILLEAKRGDHGSLGLIGALLLFDHLHVEYDRAALLGVLEKLAERSHPTALALLGMVYMDSAHGREADAERAVSLLRRAVAESLARAEKLEAEMRARERRAGGAGRKGAPKAMSAKHNMLARYGLALCHARGFGVKRDAHEAMRLFSLVAQGLHVENPFFASTLYNMGLLLLRSEGDGGASHKPGGWAFSVFEAAAERGHLYAIYLVGKMRKEVGRDCKLAVAYLKLAVEQLLLTPLLRNAERAIRTGDYHVALYHYLQAAHAGSVVAQYNAALMLENGVGVPDAMWPHRLRHATALYELASNQNSMHARLRLGDLSYARGEYGTAAALYFEAKARGNAEATFNLGMMHVFGVGLPRSFDRAKEYMDAASALTFEAVWPTRLMLWTMRLLTWTSRKMPAVYRLLMPATRPSSPPSAPSASTARSAAAHRAPPLKTLTEAALKNLDLGLVGLLCLALGVVIARVRQARRAAVVNT